MSSYCSFAPITPIKEPLECCSPVVPVAAFLWLGFSPRLPSSPARPGWPGLKTLYLVTIGAGRGTRCSVYPPFRPCFRSPGPSGLAFAPHCVIIPWVSGACTPVTGLAAVTGALLTASLVPFLDWVFPAHRDNSPNTPTNDHRIIAVALRRPFCHTLPHRLTLLLFR